MRNFFCFIFISISSLIIAQEFNAEVSINAEQTGQPNLSVFKTLGTSLEEFINNNKWTNTEYLPQERIPCSFFINVTSYTNSGSFEGTLQVQASRPVYNSGYQTTIANFNDKQVNFQYLEFQPLVFNPNANQGNLVAIVSYYLYTILGLEGDTFKELGGTEYYQKAKQIVNISQSGGNTGWNTSSGTQSRYRYNDDMLSGIFDEYRVALYNYHLKGLDLMSKNTKDAKKGIISSLEPLKAMNRKRPNSYVMRTFFDAKVTEIQKIFSGGPKVNLASTIETLNNIAPTYSKDWNAMQTK